MGVSGTFGVGISGLSTNEAALAAIADNIANVQTAGYKEQKVVFADVVATLSGGASTGLGSRVAAVRASFAQGAIERTGVSTDMAISGEGFFVVGGETARLYSRNGQFTKNAAGYLVDAQGRRVQGYAADAEGNIPPSAKIGDLQVDGLSVAAKASSDVEINLNLDSTEPVIAGGFDVSDPDNTSNASHGMTLFDSLGTSHPATMYYTKSADNTWSYSLTMDGAELDGGASGTETEVETGTLTFNADGSLQAVSQTGNTFDFAGGAAGGQSISFSFGDPIAAGGTGLLGSTQFSGSTTVNGLSQDGAASGSLTDFTVSSDGTLTGVFSNGVIKSVGRMAIAIFANQEGLTRVGGNAYQETRESGQALIGNPDTGGRGQIVGASIEGSNVDLPRSLVDMISLQRVFQANARTINVAAENLQTILSLGR